MKVLKGDLPTPISDERDVLVTLDTPKALDHYGKRVDQAAVVRVAQLSVMVTQLFFVMGSVYLKSSTRDIKRGEVFNPIVFAFAREAFAGPILWLIAYLSAGTAIPSMSDAPKIVGLGACMFASQLFYVLGIKLSGVVVATCMQPAIPVFTVMLGIVLRLEKATPSLLTGIGMAVIGSLCMVIGGASGVPASATAAAAAAISYNMLLGNCCLLANTLAMACYYIVGKQIVGKYPPVAVAAWAYLVAATFMGCTAVIFTTPADWNFPQALVLPLTYWIIVCSVAGYGVVTWAMSKLPPSQVASFQCLQPPIGTFLAFLVLHEWPNWYDLGALGVIAGLALVARKGGSSPADMMMSALKKSRSYAALHKGINRMMKE